ncbi:hypothetical protein PpBr36_04474 [Pyricularia pennisetigena]|uniref:hypothetical protein n=1 Tax=Pyricularia pennisetigena TaxID=1578925 RepID=UPI00115413F9|nr:hypothetical protein PpBr36_04474 [Pyricularia pennisetigena]TLS27352.1 hypothetical protein PpBr36_04474 [Pyricularia pennisetigena]
MTAPSSIRIPTEADFAPLAESGLHTQLHFPTPPESTTAILVLFHGLGDNETPYAGFARGMALPGVLSVAVRGPSPLPPAMLGLPLDSGPTKHFHYGDDIKVGSGDGLDPDPGFDKARRLLLDKLVGDVIVGRCGWDVSDVLLFGFGQGGSLALGLASSIRMGPQVVDLTEGAGSDGCVGGRPARGTAFRGVISVGGPLPHSMVPSVSNRPKASTPVLLCRGRASEDLDDDAVEAVKNEFDNVEVATWKKPHDGMPESRDEILPIMKFFADRLRMENR